MSSTQPLVAEEAAHFVANYNFDDTGLFVNWRIPMAEYTPCMWENLKNRVVFESKVFAQSRSAIFREIGELQFAAENEITDGVSLSFMNKHGISLEFRFDKLRNEVAVFVAGALRLSFKLANDYEIPPAAIDEGWLISDVLLGNHDSNLHLLNHGVAYQCNGLSLPLMVWGTTDKSVKEFVLPDGRRFLFDGVRFHEAK